MQKNNDRKVILITTLAVMLTFAILGFFFSVPAAAEYYNYDNSDDCDYQQDDEANQNYDFTEIKETLARIAYLIEQSLITEETHQEETEQPDWNELLDFTDIKSALAIIIELMEQENEVYHYEAIREILELLEIDLQYEPEYPDDNDDLEEPEEPEEEQPELLEDIKDLEQSQQEQINIINLQEFPEPIDYSEDLENIQNQLTRIDTILIIGFGLLIGSILGMTAISQWKPGV